MTKYYTKGTFVDSKNDDDCTVTKQVSRKIVVLEITSEQTGYTIQRLYGIEFKTSEPVVIVPTFKVNIILRTINKSGNILKSEIIDNFNVTRDSWYYLGGDKDNSYFSISQFRLNIYKLSPELLLNREFIPEDWSKNLYKAEWVANYPNVPGIAISNGLLAQRIDAFRLTRYGKKELPARPLRTQKNLDGSSIKAKRKNENIATDVLIHIGGVYRVSFRHKNYLGSPPHLGGSFGCFGFIPKNDIYKTTIEAKRASINDDYDDELSNQPWFDVTNKIISLSFPNNIPIFILLQKRHENTRYTPVDILEE